jgi:predicted nucleotide-binding protein
MPDFDRSGGRSQITRPSIKLEEFLTNSIARGTEISERDMQNNEPVRRTALTDIRHWDEYNVQWLRQAFTGEEEWLQYPTTLSVKNPSTYEMRGDIEVRLRYLKNLKDRIDLYDEVSQSIPTPQPASASPSSERTVFIVHGHKEAPKQEVARYLQTVTDLKPAILHELPKRGQTIIEGLERAAAHAVFAVVLLTADDEGGPQASHERYSRARQNVVFELGMFIGRLGRSKVAVLYEHGVELPSDMNGILYTSLDSTDAWKLALGRELLAAGVAVDLNRAI